MAKIYSLQADRILEIEANNVQGGTIDTSGNLILITHAGRRIPAGNLKSLISQVVLEDETIAVVAKDAVEAAAVELDIITRLALSSEFGLTSYENLAGYAKVVVNSAGQKLVEYRTDGSGPRYLNPVQYGDGDVEYRIRDGAPAGAHIVVGSNGRMGETSLNAEGKLFDWAIDSIGDRLGITGNESQEVRLVVRPNPGNGEYASPKLANDAANPTRDRPVVIDIHPGVYTELDWVPKKYVKLIGRDRDRCILKGENPDSATDTQISQNSTIWIKDTVHIENLTLTARNLRYVVHSESSGAIVNYSHYLRNVVLRHYGNEGARQWRRDNPDSGMSPNTVWTSQASWGMGASSGGSEVFENVTFINDHANAFSCHTNSNWTKPHEWIFRNCRFTTGKTSSLVNLQGLGAGVTSTVEFNSSEMSTVKSIHAYDIPWISSTHLPADHHEFDVVVNGLAKIGYSTSTRGRGVRLIGAAPSSSNIVLGGNAASAIFGSLPVVKLGDSVLETELYGIPDISGIKVGLQQNVVVDNTLGRRLGDCSATNKTLTVTYAGQTKSHTFNKDYTEMSNDSILAEMRPSFSGVVTIDVVDPTFELHYPSFPERQMTLLTGESIRRGQAVRISGNKFYKVRTSDPVASFYGVAIERAVAGDFVRVINSGRFDARFLYGMSDTLADGASVYLSNTTAGAFSASGTRVVMRNAVDDFAEF